MDGGIAEETAAAALAYGTLGDVVGPDVLGMELGALVLSEVEP
jgi:hypothetical protein